MASPALAAIGAASFSASSTSCGAKSIQFRFSASSPGEFNNIASLAISFGSNDDDAQRNYEHGNLIDSKIVYGEYPFRSVSASTTASADATSFAFFGVVGLFDDSGSATDAGNCWKNGYRNCIVYRGQHAAPHLFHDKDTHTIQMYGRFDAMCVGKPCAVGSTCEFGSCVPDDQFECSGDDIAYSATCTRPISRPGPGLGCTGAADASLADDAACGLGFCTATPDNPADPYSNACYCVADDGEDIPCHVESDGAAPSLRGGVTGHTCVCHMADGGSQNY
jgi:hypothetical protein